ncbi:gtpase-activating protein [Anaeramoeba ignava]|uniref:Gtpase-activating protein n=1 Tax=Anaeramoeba ignava TaxID=1746090 RepID=A0A9Q0LJ74_ANAIG|nr:gtpase-activating protein [Anaeramoeba ignava]
MNQKNNLTQSKSNLENENQTNEIQVDFLLDEQKVQEIQSNFQQNQQNRMTKSFHFSQIKTEAQYQEDVDKLQSLKNEISTLSRRNFQLEKEIKSLDQKIALLIKQKIPPKDVEEIQIEEQEAKPTFIKDTKWNENYGRFFHTLFYKPQFIASVLRQLNPIECEKVLQLVMFTIYGNHYDEKEEKLILMLFEYALNSEFSSCSHLNVLLRANTPITKLLFTYTRRGPGQLYLKNLLSSPLQEIANDDDLDLEINPVRIYENFINEKESELGEVSNLKKKITYEESLSIPEVKNSLNKRLKSIKDIFDKVFSIITSNIDLIPYGIRLICKKIATLTQEYFPQANQYDRSALIGGFFVLRFLNPAIVTPTAYHLVDGKLKPKARRNLTLLAKLLQVLSNMVDIFGKKEDYMKVLEDFMQEKKKVLVSFFEKVIQVDDLIVDQEIDNFINLSEKVVSLRITLNEIYFMHRLFDDKIDNIPSTVNKSDLEILKESLVKLGEPPKDVEKPKNFVVQLKLLNEFSESLNQNTNFTVLYNNLKQMISGLYQNMINGKTDQEIDQMNIVTELQNFRNQMKKNKNSKANHKIKRILFNMKTLVKEGIISKDNNFRQFREDVEHHLRQRDKYHEKVLGDFKTLKTVRENVMVHREYLKKQISVYQEYLDNVRSLAYNNKKKKSDSKTKIKKKAVRLSHTELTKKGVISESEVPQERQRFVFFEFSTTDLPGIFQISLFYKNKPQPLYSTHIYMESLLESQHNSQPLYEIEHVILNVNLLIHFLNKSLV